jgi:hypothetical protein
MEVHCQGYFAAFRSVVLGICVAGLILFVGRDYIQSWVGLLGGVLTALAALWKLISEMRTRSARVDSRGSDVVA